MEYPTLDKQAVGYRLALAAENVAYGAGKVVAAGPLYQAASKATLTVSAPGSRLVAQGGGPLTGFAVAGAEQEICVGAGAHRGP